MLPGGWEGRLVPVPTPSATGLCLDPHDLVVSKYVAGREKDRGYVLAAIRHALLDRKTLLQRLESTILEAERRRALVERIELDFRNPRN